MTEEENAQNLLLAKKKLIGEKIYWQI